MNPPLAVINLNLTVSLSSLSRCLSPAASLFSLSCFLDSASFRPPALCLFCRIMTQTAFLTVTAETEEMQFNKWPALRKMQEGQKNGGSSSMREILMSETGLNF